MDRDGRESLGPSDRFSQPRMTPPQSLWRAFGTIDDREVMDDSRY